MYINHNSSVYVPNVKKKEMNVSTAMYNRSQPPSLYVILYTTFTMSKMKTRSTNATAAPPLIQSARWPCVVLPSGHAPGAGGGGTVQCPAVRSGRPGKPAW